MPELPDITVYIEALERHVGGHILEHVRIANPFLVRSVEPPITEAEGKRVTKVQRIGKRIALGFETDLWIVIHLMIAGRFRWAAAGAKIPGRVGLAAFDFDNGSLILTEAGSTRRASLFVVRGGDNLRAIDRGGLEPLDCSLEDFVSRLLSENHTLKRALTDPTLFSGIGNAYSDEILHRARLSPLRLTSRLTDEEVSTLFHATRQTLLEWIDRLREVTSTGFPEKVTAFREGMAVHGRYGQPCPVCSTPVQRIRYASNETNYCPRCQTEGRLLADRALSRLLKKDWPRSIDELY
ncbi:MAG TPA: DNA-formamidopyrimidine glycosylase family protein [Rhodothermia bacterium]|nr:DNA-formamidopyrimidine glycosylase family protein [Rhodothermia bacterium]